MYLVDHEPGQPMLVQYWVFVAAAAVHPIEEMIAIIIDMVRYGKKVIK